MCNSLFVLIAGKLKVRRTKPDPCENKNDAVPPAYQNHVTHWWDGSQLYGSDRKTHDRVRSFVDGKLKVDDEGFLPLDPKSNIDITGNAAVYNVNKIKLKSRAGSRGNRLPNFPCPIPCIHISHPFFWASSVKIFFRCEILSGFPQ